MKKLKYLIASIFTLTIFILSSCEKIDSTKEWGLAKIYMPQANYNPYIVPNSGTDAQLNKNYSVDKDNGKVNIFLGIYRSGLQALESYSVAITPLSADLAGTTLLPADQYTLSTIVTCPDGARDIIFYLSVNLNFLITNSATDFSLAVTISNPSKYEINEDLATTKILINTGELLTKESIAY